VLTWDVPYTPGVLQARGNAGGRQAADFELRTAGPPARIMLFPDVKELPASGRAVCHVEVRIEDAQGVLVADASPELALEITGPAELLGIGNGDLNSIEDCKDLVHKAFQGRALAILQSTGARGAVSLKASSHGLAPATLILPVR
jgi:beta-galactosidase